MQFEYPDGRSLRRHREIRYTNVDSFVGHEALQQMAASHFDRALEDNYIRRNQERYRRFVTDDANRHVIMETPRPGRDPFREAFLQQMAENERVHLGIDWGVEAPTSVSWRMGEMTATEIALREGGYTGRRMQEAREILERTRRQMAEMHARLVREMTRPGAVMWVDEWGDVFPHFGSNPEAAERGMQLLKENLDPKQLRQYETHRHFDVVGGATGTGYRVYEGRQLNIGVLSAAGEVVSGLCFLPQGALCRGDVMLGQKLSLEHREMEALAVANKLKYPTPM